MPSPSDVQSPCLPQHWAYEKPEPRIPGKACQCLPGCQLQLILPAGWVPPAYSPSLSNSQRHRIQGGSCRQPAGPSTHNRSPYAGEEQRDISLFSLVWPKLIKILWARISKVLNTQIASAALLPLRKPCTFIMSKQICLFCEFFQQHWSGLMAARCLCFKIPVTELLPEVRAGVGGSHGVGTKSGQVSALGQHSLCKRLLYETSIAWSSALGVVVGFCLTPTVF